MSVNDALSAIKAIHTVVSKVKDNKDELASLSRRLQFIVQALQESRERDVIRDAEYEDCLSTVFELITRTERVTRRMLKRTLGDRTWNAGEIANDLRRLNEDAQAFLSVHTIKTLDFVQTAQSQQQSYLVASVEEIIAKITEIDLALSGPKPAPMLSPPIPQTMSMMTQTSATGIPAGPAKSPSGAGAGAIAKATSKQLKKMGGIVTRGNWGSEGPTATIGPHASSLIQHSHQNESQVLVEKLRAANWFSLAVSGLHKSGDLYGPGPLEATFHVPGTATDDQIKDIIERAGYSRPQGLMEDRTMLIGVTEGESVFDATAPGGLQISKDEPLLWWINKYNEYHGFTADIPMKTEVQWTRNSLQVDNLTIRCHRTLRVPDTDEASHLPPNLGPFPVFPVAQLGSRAPEDMKKRGGFIMPMFRREALWISFKCSRNSPAVKVSVGGVNAISGAVASDLSPLQDVPQDYVVAGCQPWIDGIVSGPDVVRQFVVTEIGQGYTVEEQVTGEAKIGGLQFDIFPRRPWPLRYFTRTKALPGQANPVVDEDRKIRNMTATPAELKLEQQTIAYVRWDFYSYKEIESPPSGPWVLSGYVRRLSSTPTLKAKYPDGPPCIRSFPSASTVTGMPMSINSSRLGVAAGGRIKQKIYRDSESVRVYNEQLGRRVHIHIVTPEYWEELTGILPPVTPVTRELYAKQGMPWYQLFDDYMDSITEVSEALASVLSVTELDKVKTKATAVKVTDPVVDPDAPPPCFVHRSASSAFVFRPCGHAVCAQCFGLAFAQMAGGSTQCSCGSLIVKFVGMKQPVPQISMAQPTEDESDSGMNHWNVQEIEQLSIHAAQSGKVVVIHRPEDNVAPLQQKDPVSPIR